MSFLQSMGLMRGFGGAHLRAMSQHACNFDQLVASAAVLAHSYRKGGAVDHGTEVLKSHLPWCTSPCQMAISWLLSLADVLAYHVSIMYHPVSGAWYLKYLFLSLIYGDMGEGYFCLTRINVMKFLLPKKIYVRRRFHAYPTSQGKRS